MKYTHVFEQAGLGQAPYQFLRCVQSSSSCQFCGTKIMYRYYLQSKDGNEFFVGSDCILKSGDQGLTKVVKDYKAQKRAELKETMRLAREQQRQQEADHKREQFLVENSYLIPLLDWANTATEPIAMSITNSLQRWGSLSEGQIQLLKQLHTESLQPKIECPKGTIVIEGEITRLSFAQGYQGGSVLKMTVKSKEGYTVYGTVPVKLKLCKIGRAHV